MTGVALNVLRWGYDHRRAMRGAPAAAARVAEADLHVLGGRRQCAAVQGRGASVDGTFTLDPTYVDHNLAHGACRCGAGLELAPGGTTCALCAPGQFKVVGAVGCTGCPVGKFQPASGQASCVACAAGTDTSAPDRKSA